MNSFNTTLTDAQKSYQFSQLKRNLVLNIGVLVIFIGVYGFYFSPKLAEIEALEGSLVAQAQEYQTIKKQGLSQAQLLSFLTEKQSEQKDLIEKSGEELYQSIFTNTTQKEYLDFLKDKETALGQLKNSDFLAKRDEKLSASLPFFGDGVDSSVWVLSDLSYISYLERLLRTFNLTSEQNLTIWELELVNPDEIKNVKNAYSAQIFYIPLDLNVRGRKADIVDFLHFIQHVWNVTLVQENSAEDLVFHTDNVINKNIFTTTQPTSNNIYENMIMDVTSVSFSNYIDESDSQRSPVQKSLLGFINFIKNSNNATQVIDAQMSVRFYVRGMPLYKKESYIQSVISDFETLKKDVQVSLQKAKNRTLQKTNVKLIDVENALTSLQTYVNTLDPKIKTMRVGMTQKANVENVYEQAFLLRKELGVIQKTLQSNKTLLDWAAPASN